MSSSVHQGLQSCLETRLLEPLISNEKLAPQKSNFSKSIPWSQKPSVFPQRQEQSDENKKNIISNKCSDYECRKGRDLGWSFLQALANNNGAAEAEQVYVVKPSSSALSTQSLEMCTESLGSETGSSIDEIMNDLSPEKQSYQGIKRTRSREYFTKKMGMGSHSFPPPLTSISVSDGIQMRPHREGGRLVLEAVSSRSRTCFRAERVDGRLRLFTLSESGCYDCEEFERESAAAEEQDYSEETDEEEEEEDDESSFECEKNGANFECEIGVEEFPRLSRRCKEGRNCKLGAILGGYFLKERAGAEIFEKPIFLT